MRTLRTGVFLVFGCAVSGGAVGAQAARPQAACSAGVRAGADVDAIRALEDAGAASNVKGMSREEAERMFAPEYVTIGPDGAVTARDGVMKNYASGRSAPWATAFTIQQLTITVYCGTATAVGLAQASGQGPDGQVRSVNFRWLNVWVKSGSGWRLTATQFARFAPPSTPAAPAPMR